MGIYYSAAIIVGLPVGEIENEEIVDELDMVCPYYDGSDAAIVGVVVTRSDIYSACEFEYDQAAVDAAKAKFLAETGQVGKLYLSPRGS